MTPPAALPPGDAIGILGGGQLGRMLAQAAARLGLDTVLLDPDPDAPAARVASEVIAAPHAGEAALRRLAGRVRRVTWEFENVPAAALDRLVGLGVEVRPGARSLRVARDRRLEKEFLAGLGIPVAAWRPVSSAIEARDALAALGAPAILKTRRFGYDGKGQIRLRAGDDPGAAWAELGGVPAVLEQQVDFTREFSLLGVRGAEDTVIAYEATWNLHRAGILRRSRVPAGIPVGAARAARDAVWRVQRALGHVGALAIEFFLLPDGSMLANEIAPRVHNSGHWTLDAADLDQFEAHMRAVAGWPLPSPRRTAPVEMENLLGDEVGRWPELAAEPGLRLHLYGKRVARPGRKMGHATRLGDNDSRAAG